MFKQKHPFYRQLLADIRPKQKKGPDKKVIGLGFGSMLAALVGAVIHKNRDHS